MPKSLPHRLAPFFWLHIKKSAGGSVRRILAPDYDLAQRTKQPVNFIQSPRSQHNDILNNFRVPLGDYQFRRTAFAQTYLYPDCWDQLVRFAFMRPPLERCLSMFFYLARPRGGERSFVQHLQEQGHAVDIANPARLFDQFLDLVEAAQTSPSIYQPVNLHFTTHTAAVHGDVMDANGQMGLTQLFRLEDMAEAIAMVFELCQLSRSLPAELPHHNARKDSSLFAPSPAQLRRVETLYQMDFELYESAHITRFSAPKPH